MIPIRKHGTLILTIQIGLSPMLDTNIEFACEKYLDFITEKKYKVVLTRFRLSSHELQPERGRYGNTTPRWDKRLCKCWNVQNREWVSLFACMPSLCRLKKEIFQTLFLPLA